jgi:2-C-methyl-D-erythritol 2,4-cyclodiphosphate synthase
MNRVGLGYDVHQLKDNRPLILGGVEIPHERGLDGHSDADVIMHAICDAILGALGEGDIGSFFPPSDPQWKDASSKIFLEEAAKQIKKQNGRLINIDAMLIAEAPKISPYIPDMKKNIANALGVSPKDIGIKATTNETMGFVGRGEGMAAHAVASVELPQ